MSQGSLFLGIDLGTSKVALALCDRCGSGVFHLAASHHADLPGPPGTAEQDAEKILATACDLIAEIPGDHRAHLAGIGLTGQMHGVVQHDEQGRACSPLVTWQDTRQNELKINGRTVPPGRGWGTLERWVRSKELSAPRCATIHGLLAARICRLDRAPIDPTDRHAWGALTPPPSIPASILPDCVPHGALVGHSHGQKDLPDGLPVAAPLGDNQASIRGTLSDFKNEAAFTIGTGCQLSIPLPAGHPAPTDQDRWEIRPFDRELDLLVAAPRNGGLVWRWLAERVARWSRDLGGPDHELNAAYNLLDQLGTLAQDRLRFEPRLIAEGDEPNSGGILSGFRPDSGEIGEIIRAVARSIPENALAALPEGALAGRTTVQASGNALRHSKLLRDLSAEILDLQLQPSVFPEEAALGAARVGWQLWTQIHFSPLDH